MPTKTKPSPTTIGGLHLSSSPTHLYCAVPSGKTPLSLVQARELYSWVWQYIAWREHPDG